jgi:hypothetical protein
LLLHLFDQRSVGAWLRTALDVWKKHGFHHREILGSVWSAGQ